MAEIPPTNPDLTPLSRYDRVDCACDRFEDAWTGGARPRIEDYLAEAPAADRPALLTRLVALDVCLRRLAGEVAEAASYRARFPECPGAIEAAIADASPSADFRLEDPATLPSFDGKNWDASSPPPTLGPRTGPHTDHAEALPTGTILGDYELLDILGEGGMGVVYRAWQRGAGRVVALKLIQPGWIAGMPADRAAEVIALFLGEAQMAAKLEHDHIVTIHDVGHADGRPYYSMRCVEGRSLAAILRDGPLPDARAAEILEPVARAVQHAHDRKVLHRDLKPANILVDERGRPFVADFGLAKLLESPEASSLPLGRAGTPSYMSPEQAKGSADVGPASDVYSLGATLYDLLTGRPPFRAAGHRETMRQVIHATPVPPRRLNPAIGRDLEAICLKCLEKDPHARYPDAGTLADDLLCWREGRPTVARPMGPIAKLARRARRHRAAIAAAAAAVVVIAGLSAEVWRLSTDLALVAVLAEFAPAGASDDDRRHLAERQACAAVQLARRGRADLIPPSWSRGRDHARREDLMAREGD